MSLLRAHPRRRILAFLFAAASGLQAQSARKPISQDVYDSWKTISGSSLSADGQWVTYTHSPVVGNGEVVLRSTKAATEWRYPRGFTGRPQMVPNADSTAQFNLPAAQFSSDSKWLAFTTYASRAEFGAARGGLARAAATPRNSLTLVSTADGKATVIPKVRSYKFARDGGRYIAYLFEADSATSATGGGRDGAGGGRGGRNGGAGGTAAPEPASTLVLRDLLNGTDTKIERVTAYVFDEAEKVLAYTTGSAPAIAVIGAEAPVNGAYVRDLASGRTTALLTGKGSYLSLVLDRKGTQAAFVSDYADADASKPKYALYYSVIAGGKNQMVPAPATEVVMATQFGHDIFIADRGRVDFTRDGSALLFSLAKPIADAVPTDSLVDKAVYDLWHWQDPVVNPVQKNQVARDRARTYLAIYHPDTKKALRLADDSVASVTVTDNGKMALASNGLPYAIDAGWGEGGSDVWLIDATSGTRTLVSKRMRNAATLSTAGQYVAMFQEGSWRSRNIATGKTVDLTAQLKDAHFYDEESVDSDEPRPFGIAGWTKDDARLLVYDKSDIWELDPTGGIAPIVLTGSYGKKNNITFRVVDLDREEPGLDAAKPLLMRALNNDTKESGYWRGKFGIVTAPEQIVMGPKNYNGLAKARKADEYIMTQQTYREFPDLWVGSAINQVRKVSNANPQDGEYSRGAVELVTWLSDDGVKLQGLLHKPEGFDPSRKYPMVVTFYEKLSDGLHNYIAPTGRNAINPLVYNSLGYLVFTPDIVYTIGQPGPSAAKAVIPGIQSLIARGFVDPKKIGVMGQSWGGYQIAYLITVTNIFAAAIPDAAVVNMTSAYGGIRWESGIARTGQYEHGQSRIGGSLWQYPQRFIENSPLFHLDRVTTPIFWMENDADGAVPWYQGIEFYLAMRRLKKEAYMVTYNNEGHNPSKRANQKDMDKKQQEFFANKLLGTPAPEWMTRGIPFLDKSRDQLKAGTAGGMNAAAVPPTF